MTSREISRLRLAAQGLGELPVDERTGNPMKGGINYVARDGHPTPPKVVDHLKHFLAERNAMAATRVTSRRRMDRHSQPSRGRCLGGR